MASLAYAGYILALIGGILIVVFSLLGILGTSLFAFSPIVAIGALAYGLVGLIIGLICIVGSKYVGNLGWAIVLIILGIIVGGIGGVLVVLGALLGLVSKL
jgi:hypothetical protein